jgi:hypothetical protein
MTLEQFEHLAGTFGIPVVMLGAVMFGFWRVCSVLGPTIKAWFESQIKMVDVVGQTLNTQTEILTNLGLHAKHGHRALHHALDSLDALSNHDPKVKEQTDRARDCLME